MPLTQDEFVKFLREKAIERWNEFGEPYFISSASPDLKNMGKSYQDAIGEERLKSFVRRIEGPENFKVVEHPRHKAKVGLIPYDADFEFESSLVSEVRHEVATRIAQRPQGEKAVIAFLHSLANLPDEEARQVVIPAYILARMMKR